MNLRSF